MKKRFIISILFLFLNLLSINSATASEIQNLEIDLKTRNNHSNIKIVEGKKDFLKINFKNFKNKVEVKINGGADKNLFNFDAENKILSFKKAINFSQPEDFDKNNIYRLSLQIKDGEKEIIRSIWVYIKKPLVKINKKQTKGVGVYALRRQENCKDSRALNFSARGQHKQELCIYKEDVLAEIKEIEKQLAEIIKLQNQQKKTFKNNLIQKENKKTLLTKNITKHNQTKISQKIKNDSKILTQKNNKVIKEVIKRNNLSEKKLATKDSEIKKNNSGQQASIIDAQKSSQSSTGNSFWPFGTLIILIIIATGLILLNMWRK